MDSRDTLEQEVGLLKKDPSRQRWEIHLQRMLAGELRYLVNSRSGSYEDWIELLLLDATDQALSRSFFIAALERVVQAWQPSALDTNDHLSCMLNLIGAYTPTPGYYKVSKKIKILLEEPATRSRRDSRKVSRPRQPLLQLRKQMLGVLKQYYPVAPYERDPPGFPGYIEILRQHLRIPGCTGIAARHLIQLAQLDIADSSVVFLLKREPESIGNLLREVINSNQASVVQKQLNILHNQVLLAGRDAIETFILELQKLKGSYLQTPGWPEISINSYDEPFRLDIPERKAALKTYWTVRWDLSDKLTRMKLPVIERLAAEDERRLAG